MKKQTPPPDQASNPEEVPEIFAVEKDGNTTRLNRRDFIKAAAVTTVAATIMACDMSSLAAGSSSPTPLNTDTPAEAPTTASTATNIQPPATDTPLPTATTKPAPQVVANANSNVRNGPNGNAGIVGLFSQGAQAPVIGKSGDNLWFCIQLPDGTIGWVSATMVILTGSLDEIPYVTPIPTPCGCVGYVAPTATFTGPGCSCVDNHYWYPN